MLTRINLKSYMHVKVLLQTTEPVYGNIIFFVLKKQSYKLFHSNSKNKPYNQIALLNIQTGYFRKLTFFAVTYLNIHFP